MGYESRIFIVNRHVHEFPSGESWVFGDKLAEIELCKMGHNKNFVHFRDIFKIPIDFNLYEIADFEGCMDEDFRKDCYGEHCKYTSIDDVVEYLEGLIKEGEVYWRLLPAIACLKAWKNNVTGLSVEPVVVHWGH